MSSERLGRGIGRRVAYAVLPVVVVIVVAIRPGRRGRHGDGRDGPLLLHEAMQFEPIGSTPVAGAALGHAHQQALAQSARFARRPVLLVDDALAAVLAFGYHRQVVVGATEKRL